jgi:immunoglobulin-like protein involved in spore germination/sporulation and spore germination protein
LPERSPSGGPIVEGVKEGVHGGTMGSPVLTQRIQAGMPFRALTASTFLAALALVGCGGNDGPSSSSSTSTTDTVETTETQSEEHESEPIIIALYFLRDGQVGLTRHHAVEGPKVGTAALEQLLGGPTPADREAGLTTDIPAGTSVERLSIMDGIAAADFSRELSPAAAAQVVYTLTQFPTVRRVAVNGAAPLRRADLEELTPPILVEVPAPGGEASRRLRIIGTANTFEATFNVEVLDASGRVVGKRFVTATSGSGTRGTFEADVHLRAPQRGPGKLVVFELSAEDGSRIHEVTIPVELVP